MNTARKLELLQQQIDEANDGNPVDFTAWKDRTSVVVRKVLGATNPSTVRFNKNGYSLGVYSTSTSPSQHQAARSNGVRRAISILKAAMVEVELEDELANEVEDIVTSTSEPARSPEPGQRVFIVHGHADAKKHELARVLLKLTGAEPTILHEETNQGGVLMEKFERSAAATGYAVVLLTADDHGNVKTSTDLLLRGRQNVVFEMGFFFGAFGRSHVSQFCTKRESSSPVTSMAWSTPR